MSNGQPQQAQIGNPMIPNNSEYQQQVQQQVNEAGAQAPAPQQQAPQEQTQPQSTDFDWFGFSMDFDESEPRPDSQQAPAPDAGAQQQASELTPEQKEAIAQAKMGQQPQQPQQPQAQPQQQAPQEQQAIDYLLQTQYALSDDEKKQLVSEPDVAIPTLAARMHVRIATQIAQYMQHAVPQMAQHVLKSQMGAFKAEQRFFQQFPELGRQEFRGVVLQSLKYAKALNPQANRDTIMKEAAELAAHKLKVQLGGPRQQPQAQQPNGQARPPQQPQQQHQQVPPPGVFMPAAGGNAAQIPQGGQPQFDNIFEELAADDSW